MTVEAPHYETTSTHNYTKQYRDMKKLTWSNISLGLFIISFALICTSFLLGLLIRLSVAWFNAGYTFFGLW